jgi:hypothetical protein
VELPPNLCCGAQYGLDNLAPGPHIRLIAALHNPVSGS